VQIDCVPGFPNQTYQIRQDAKRSAPWSAAVPMKFLFDTNIWIPLEPTSVADAAPDTPPKGRLAGVLEMQRHDPAGNLLPPDKHVFGNEVGDKVRDIRTTG
jgi:hypothetical protein